MIHLTLTGFYAGTPICSVDKAEAKAKGDKFAHYMYFYNMDHPDLCPACKLIAEEAESDTFTLLTEE